MSLDTQLKKFNHAAGAAVKANEPNTDGKAAPATSKVTPNGAKAKTGKPKAAKETTNKPEPSKVAAKAEPNTDRRSPFANEALITVKSTEHGFKGKRGKALDTLKDGTVENFKAALAKKSLPGYAGWALRTAVEKKLITVK